MIDRHASLTHPQGCQDKHGLVLFGECDPCHRSLSRERLVQEVNLQDLPNARQGTGTHSGRCPEVPVRQLGPGELLAKGMVATQLPGLEPLGLLGLVHVGVRGKCQESLQHRQPQDKDQEAWYGVLNVPKVKNIHNSIISRMELD
ncbi:Transposable element tcb1 transposase, partial [Caligus rogercresseyi]